MRERLSGVAVVWEARPNLILNPVMIDGYLNRTKLGTVEYIDAR